MEWNLNRAKFAIYRDIGIANVRIHMIALPMPRCTFALFIEPRRYLIIHIFLQTFYYCNKEFKAFFTKSVACSIG